jgi:hypothetical protein
MSRKTPKNPNTLENIRIYEKIPNNLLSHKNNNNLEVGKYSVDLNKKEKD